jgi:hypothetical protein
MGTLSTSRSRISTVSIASAVYFGISLAYLLWLYGDDTFCERLNERPWWAPVAILAGVVTAFDATLDLILNSYRAASQNNVIRPACVIAFVWGALTFLPFWIYGGYGHFRFEGSWIDVSCLVTEAWGMAFPFTVAPVFALLSAVRQVVIRKTFGTAETLS